MAIILLVRKASNKRLFENIIRLRRAERNSPGDRDIGIVRADLEVQLGPTVTRSMAAALLGVSHTALIRWVNAGDIPVVPQRDGRVGVPVSALFDLREAIDAERASGERKRHPLEPAIKNKRRLAENLRPQELIDGDDDVDSRLDPHRRSELRSLAYHRALARRLRRSMADEALTVVRKWRESGRIHPRYADEWERILIQPVPEIRKALRDDSQQARDLRQNSPFAGVLSEAERNRILAEIS